jgi:hypothetical protein
LRIKPANFTAEVSGQSTSRQDHKAISSIGRTKTGQTMKSKTYRNGVLAIAALVAIATFSKSAEAQFHPSYYGSAEADTRNSQFYLLGTYLGVGGFGWSPYFNANAYLLDYPVLNTKQNLSAVSPTVGFAYAARSQGVSIGAGYAWVHNPNPGAPGAEGGGSNGVTASLGAYHRGRGRSLYTQLLANYNFGSQYVWARGRASEPFGTSATHPARVGIEVVGQGGGKDGSTSSIFEVGPTFEYAWSPSLRTTGTVGYKNVGGSFQADRESAAYFKLEFSLSP